jgi:hypothetical protein
LSINNRCEIIRTVSSRAEYQRTLYARLKNDPQWMEKRRAYRRIYYARPEVEAMVQTLRQRPDAKVKRQAYNQRTEVKARSAVNLRDWRKSPKGQAYLKSLRYRLPNALRNRLGFAVRSNCKTGSAIRDLGCTIEEFRNWLEWQFQPGMSWDNWGDGPNDWQIDHIMPLIAFDLSDRRQFLIAAHFTNQRPLWKVDNMQRRFIKSNIFSNLLPIFWRRVRKAGVKGSNPFFGLESKNGALTLRFHRQFIHAFWNFGVFAAEEAWRTSPAKWIRRLWDRNSIASVNSNLAGLGRGLEHFAGRK